MTLTAKVAVSVVVPVYNGAATIESCLRAVLGAACPGMEIIVVDDRSTDDTVELARAMGVLVIENRGVRGPAAARNLGAQVAQGDIIFFVDADVIVQPTTVGRVLEAFERYPEAGAVFGSYDTAPAAPNFLSQYKNLFHHFMHQQANAGSGSFWAGCGAIRREVFRTVGGFDEAEFRRPSTEDIELGMRLRERRYPVRLEKSLQVKHLKRWGWLGLLRADILDRAHPWSRLLARSGRVPNDLNLRPAHRLSAVLVVLLTALAPLFVLGPPRLAGVPIGTFVALSALALLAVLFVLNRTFYRFLAQHRGVGFAALAVPVHLLYYLYSGVTFVCCWCYYRLRHTGKSRFAT